MTRTDTPSDRAAPPGGRIRAVRSPDFDHAIAARADALRAAVATAGRGPDPRVLRALRAERRRRGGSDYDLIRHIALSRCARAEGAGANTKTPPR